MSRPPRTAIAHRRRRALLVAWLVLIARPAFAIVTADINADPTVVGGKVTYRISLSRYDTTSERNVAVTIPTPAGHQLLSLALQAGTPLDCTTATGGTLGSGVTATCAGGAGGAATFAIPDVGVTYTVNATYRVSVAASSNQVSFTCSSTAACPGVSNTATPAVGIAPVTLVKTASASSVQADHDFDYTLTLTQTAPTDVVGFQLHDDLPESVTVSTVTSPIPQSTVTINGRAVDVRVDGPLDPNKPYPFVLHAHLAKTANQPFTNRAQVTPPGGTAVPSNELTLPVASGPPPLVLAKSASQLQARVGEPIGFQLTVTPDGAQAGPIVLTDPLDASLQLTSVQLDGQATQPCGAQPAPAGPYLLSCGADGRSLRIEVPAGQTLAAPLRVQLTATVLPTAPPTLTNVATLTDAAVPPHTTQASASVSIANASSSGASVLVTAGKTLAQRADLVPFVVTIGIPEGASPLPAPRLILGSTAGLRIGDVRVTAPGGAPVIARPTEQNGALVLPLPALAAGATLTAQVRTRVNDRATVGAREALSAQLSQDGNRLGGASAAVRIVADADFDLGTLVGDVYRDDNGNGVRDRGERGLEGAQVVMDDGLQVVTDAQGRYHLAAVIPGDRAIKVARHTLPPGSRFTTDETRVVLVTAGSFVKVDFGVRVPQPEAPLPRPPADAPTALPELKPGDAGGLLYQLYGQAAPGAQVMVDGHAAVVDRKTGLWGAQVVLRRGRNRLSQVTAWPDGRLVVASRDVFWVERSTGGSLILPRDEDARLVLRFPPSALAEPTFTLEGTAPRGVSDLHIAGQKLAADASGHFAVKLKVPEAGAGIAVAARFADGFETRFDHTLSAGGDFFLLVGLAEAKLGYVQREGAAGQSGLYAQGRVKLYAKGRIQGRWLLEGGLDLDTSQLDSWRDLFRGDPQKLFRNLDPDKLYTVYGDASQASQQAQSRARLFVRIAIDRSELRFGNLQTGLTGVELGRYQRAVTGGRVEYVRAASDDPAAPPSTQVIVFGAWLQTARAHDELRGTGGSLFYLSHKTIVEGSEQVRIEVRDRVSDRPVVNQAERAQADYEIDYLAGRILLRDPLSSVASSPTLIRSSTTDGDANWLVVDYEYLVDGDLDDGTIGARATQKLGPVRLGGTVVNEFRTQGSYTLLGADLQLDLKKWGIVVGEYAHSYGSLSSFSRSDDGGLSYLDAQGRSQAADAKREGNAWKAEADLHGWGVSFHPYARGVDQGYTDTAHAQDAGYLQWGGELSAEFWKLKVKAHYDERRFQQASYDVAGLPILDANGQQVTLRATQRDAGGELSGTFGRVGLRLGARSERVDDTDPLRAGHRTTVGARLDVKIVPKLTLYGAGQYAVEHGGGQGLTSLDNSLGALGLIADVGLGLKLTAEGSYGAQGAGGLLSLRSEPGPGRVLYGTVTLSQDRDDRLLTTIAAGGRERVTDKQGNARAVLFAEDQFRDGPADLCVARSGCDTGGRAHVLATGVDVPLSKRLQLGATFERGTLQPSGTPLSLGNAQPIERNAGTLYASYGGDRLRLQARGELRSDSQSGSTSPLQWVAQGMATFRPHPDWTLRAKAFFSRSSASSLSGDAATLARSSEADFGFSWRPSFTDRIVLLGRYTWLEEFPPLTQATNTAVDPLTGQPLDLRERAHVMSLAADGRILWRISLGEKIAAKLKEEPTLGTSNWYILWVNRLSLHVTRRWDAVVEYRLVTVPGVSLTHGVSLEANVIVVGHLRLGAGYNFADFSDNELTLGRGSEKGFFVRAQGFY